MKKAARALVACLKIDTCQCRFGPPGGLTNQVRRECKPYFKPIRPQKEPTGTHVHVTVHQLTSALLFAMLAA